MGYQELINIAGLYKEEDIINKLCSDYYKKKINGLYYFEYKSATNTTAIISPQHIVHHESTCFLIDIKHSATKINTVLSKGRDLKKFLDFLLIWDIDLSDFDVNLKVVIIGFIAHLRVIDQYRFRPVANWSFLTKIPMHEKAQNIGKVLSVGYNKNDIMEEQRFEKYSIHQIATTISTVLAYLDFLKDRTHKYKNINVSIFPFKARKISRKTLVSGITGSMEEIVYDINALLELAHLDTDDLDSEVKTLEEEIFTQQEIELFMSSIDDNDHQNKLAFNMLKCFGLRRAELSNLIIEPNSLPKKFYDWDFNDAVAYLKENLKGDIVYSSEFGWWVCTVKKRGGENRNKQNKTKNRKVRLLRSFMTSDDFATLLTVYIQERQFMIEQSGSDNHKYLFISNSNRSRNLPITGATIYSRYYSIAEKSPIRDRLLLFNPHTFRHFFATYLIREKKIEISDVSELLGHSDPQITRKIYLHYLPQKDIEKDKSISQARKIAGEFKGAGILE